MKYPKTDLVSCTPSAFKDCLDFAFDIGRRDEMDGLPERSGAALAALLTIRYRGGHARALRAIYTAARFHVRTMGAN